MVINVGSGREGSLVNRAYLIVIVCINAYFLATVIANVVYFRRATHRPRIRSGPFISVIVPARNERTRIADCVRSLLSQSYADYEVIVVDDDSADETRCIVAALAEHDSRLRLVSSDSLPQGWFGKAHALSLGAEIARGEILLFTDADTVHEHDSIAWAMTNMEDHRADLLSGYLKQEYGSFGETLIVPTMFAMMLAAPLWLVPRVKLPGLAFSIGQFVAVRRAAYDALGGFESVKDVISEDMVMARRAKQFGYRNVFLDASKAARCRLYASYSEAFEGIERSIYSSMGATPLAVVGMALLVLGCIVGPAFSVGLSAIDSTRPSLLLSASVVIFLALWIVLAWDRDVPVLAVVLYPIVFLNLLVILIASMLTTGFGRGMDWKGRFVRVARAEQGGDEGDRSTLGS